MQNDVVFLQMLSISINDIIVIFFTVVNFMYLWIRIGVLYNA